MLCLSFPYLIADKLLKIRLVAQVNLAMLGEFIHSRTSANSSVLMAINALNVMIRNDASLLYFSKRASFYPPPREGEAPYLISGGLEMWGGYFTSIRPAVGKLIVNLDRTAMSFIMAGDLVQVATRFMNLRDPSEITRAMDRTRVNLERFVKGLTISTRGMQMSDGSGRSSQKKTYKIRALGRGPASQQTFEGDNGEQWTIVVSTLVFFAIPLQPELMYLSSPVLLPEDVQLHLQVPQSPRCPSHQASMVPYGAMHRRARQRLSQEAEPYSSRRGAQM